MIIRLSFLFFILFTWFNVVAQEVHGVAVRDSNLIATFFHPKPDKTLTVIVTLGGSAGGIKHAEGLAQFISERGFAALALAYFRIETLPKHLTMIPLEYFEKAIQWLNTQANIDTSKIGLAGISKGGEIALTVASTYSAFKAVAGFVPSSVVFEGIVAGGKGSGTAGLSYQGNGLPFVPYIYPKDIDYGPGNWTPLYLAILEQKEKVEAASIKVERINGPIVLFSSRQDNTWPSHKMSEMIVQRLEEHQFQYYFKHISYDGGHGIAKLDDARRDMISFFQQTFENFSMKE